MRRRVSIGVTAALALLCGAALPAQAQQAEAKDAARSANCSPGKLEVLKQVTGRLPETVYKITCVGQKDVFIVIQCRDRICTVLR